MTAHGMCGRFEIFESARHFRIEFESGLGRPIRIRIESRSFAGQWPTPKPGPLHCISSNESIFCCGEHVLHASSSPSYAERLRFWGVFPWVSHISRSKGRSLPSWEIGAPCSAPQDWSSRLFSFTPLDRIRPCE